MGFDIHLPWPVAHPDPQVRNERLAADLLSAFPALRRFPLDHDRIAAIAEVPRERVLEHWNQVELTDESGDLSNLIVQLWLNGVWLELPSTPPAGCQAALDRINPLLSFLAARGLSVPSHDVLLTDYERQRQLVQHVARLVNGQS